MISELGFVYFLGKTAEKKVVRVWHEGSEKNLAESGRDSATNI
jgi:hypothetical protein